MEQLTIPLRPILLFLVVLGRVGGLVTFAPFWNLEGASRQVRIVLALILALVITPVVAPYIPTPPSDFVRLGLAIAGEVLIGAILGFAAQLVFSGLEFAAQIFTTLLGFNLATTIDPTSNAQTTVFATLARMAGLAIMLAVDGHHWLLSAAVGSFQRSNVSGLSNLPALAQFCLRISADALAVGVALAAPAMIVVLTVEFSLAIAGRVAPQLNVMILGFPVKIAVGLWLIGASLYFLPGAVRDVLGQVKTGLMGALDAMK